MRNFLFAICLLGISFPSHAQRSPPAWGNLNTLHPGDRIQVRELNASKLNGKFLTVSDAAISLQVGGASQSIQKLEVESVKLMKHQHRLRNALIVAGVGAGIGAVIGAASDRSCPSTQAFCLDIGGRSLPAAVGAVLGALGGAATGALLPSNQTVYAVPAK